MKQHTRTIKNELDKQRMINWLSNTDVMPLVITVKSGDEKRRDRQNRLAFAWMKDAAEQGDQTAEEYRAFCKLHFGIPILREDEDFREKYDEHVKPRNYQEKLALMLWPFDFPVTRLMSIKQMTRYLDEVWRHFNGIGIQLTDPAMLGMEDLLKNQSPQKSGTVAKFQPAHRPSPSSNVPHASAFRG